jgi:AraC family transcriptional regulator of adaptative response / DNA-3-methyladenine glycosylase II
MRADPAKFKDVKTVVKRSGFGTTRCFELFRQHFHTTPADLLLRSRIDQARKLLGSGDTPLSDVAADAGFESISVFHEHFKEQNGMTPTDYRKLRSPGPFTVILPEGFPLARVLRALGRDPQSVTERLVGTSYVTSANFAGTPGLLRLELSQKSVVATADTEGGSNSAQRQAAHRLVIAMLGLDQDAAAFSRLAKKLGIGRLVAGRQGLRLLRTPSLWDAILWAIVGQQINLPFAFALKRRLIENTGTPLKEGLYSLPTPKILAKLDPEATRPWQYSQKKAEYVIGAAKLVAEGKLDLEALPLMSATRAERTLLAVHGLGPWSVNYIMMRSLGFADCVPFGDTGVTSGLKTLFKLEVRPDVDGTRRLMSVFSPHRSLATAHLWQINQPEI